VGVGDFARKGVGGGTKKTKELSRKKRNIQSKGKLAQGLRELKKAECGNKPRQDATTVPSRKEVKRRQKTKRVTQHLIT